MERMRWLRLHGCQVLLIVFLINAGFLASAQTAGEIFLQVREQQVQSIVASALANYADACGLVASCTGSDACSQAACNPTVRDLQESNCSIVAHNTKCSCSTVRADYLRSYVSVPMLGDGMNINPESVTSICSQRKLDYTYRSFPTSETYHGFYFGTVDGTFRLFPGAADENCDTYDPRLRPWYVGAISVVKDLVVLVDVASTMGDKIDYLQRVTPIGSAILMTKVLLGTLAEGDRVTVMAYGSGSSLLHGAVNQYTVRDAVPDPNDSQFVKLLDNVSNFTASTVSGSSNATAAISQAVQVLGSGSPEGALMVIVVFTDGKSRLPSEALAGLVAQLDTNMTTVFIYQINGSDPGLVSLACALQRGYSEQLTANPLQNPPYALKSYFNFLAHCRNLSSGPYFWQQPYLDYAFLGEVITVASPAISPTGDLVGVAGIDVQVSNNSIDSILLSEIRTAIRNRTISQPKVSSVPKLSKCDAGTNNGPTSCIANTSKYALCPGDGNELTFVQRLCCPSCGGYNAPESKKMESKKMDPAIWIAIGTLVGVLVVCLAAYGVWKHYWRLLPRPTLPPPHRSLESSPPSSPPVRF